MKKSIDLMHTKFESSSRPTPQFRQFTRTFKSEFTKMLKGHATDIRFTVGHFEISGFFRTPSSIWYFNTGNLMDGALRDSMLLRTATSFTDYTGGINQWVSTKNSNTFTEQILALINKGAAPRNLPCCI